jgi:peptide/nickel transport system substrate-binding protein
MILLGLTLVLVLACGSAAPATPDPTATSPAAPADAAPTTAPTAPVASDTAQPTSTPQMAAPPAEVEVNPGKVTIMVGDLANERFDNAFEAGSGGQNYGRILHGYLISDNERKDMVPGIASHWGLSPDGLTWTFTIRKGVKWHDGSELTPQDVLWSLQHQYGPQAYEYTSNSTALTVSQAMDRIELSGPDKVSVTSKKHQPDMAVNVSELTASWAGHVMPKRAELHDEAEELAYDLNPIAAGSMKLVGHTPAQVMKFERFDDFYYQPENGFPEDKRVNFQSMDMFLVSEESTRVAALRAGEADIVPASLASKEQVEAGGGRLVFGQEGVAMEVRLPGCFEPQHPCHDRRVRQALNYAIDKELIRDQLYGGPEVFQVKGWNAVTPSTIGYTPELDPLPFDPDKARQLLADAGYPGGEGFGKLIVNTQPSATTPFLVESAQLGAEFWRRELGLDVEVRVSDSTGISKAHKAGDLNGQILWQDNQARKDATSYISSRYGDPEHVTRAHEDPEILRLTQETYAILDPDKQAEAAKKLFPRLRDESYWLGIGYVNIPWGVGPRVLTWEPYPLSTYPSALHTVTLK